MAAMAVYAAGSSTSTLSSFGSCSTFHWSLVCSLKGSLAASSTRSLRADRQVRGDLVAVTLEREGGVLAHRAPLPPQESPAQRLGAHGADLIRAGGEASQGSLTRLGVDVLVVNTFQPGPERLVECP